jgi:CheY-like chemotaxis protein
MGDFVIGRGCGSPQTPAKRILIVDGNRFARRMLRSLLFSAGFDAEAAANEEVARDMLTKKEFDLLVIDIDMPAVNVREVYQCVKGEHPSCKVIFMSASILDSDTQRFLKEANRPFLPKPFTVNQLIAAAGWARENDETGLRR